MKTTIVLLALSIAGIAPALEGAARHTGAPGIAPGRPGGGEAPIRQRQRGAPPVPDGKADEIT